MIPNFIYCQVISYPDVIIKTNLGYKYNLSTVPINENMGNKNTILSRQALIHQDSIISTTLPIEFLGKNSCLLLEIEFDEKIMSIYCSYLGFSTAPWFSNYPPNFIGISFENLRFEEGCFYYNLNPYSTTSLYKFSDKKIELEVYNSQKVLKITSKSLVQYQVDCNQITKEIEYRKIKLGLFPTIKIDVSLMVENRGVDENTVSGDTYLFTIIGVCGFDSYFGGKNFFRQNDSLSKNYIYIPIKEYYSDNNIIRLKIKEFKSQETMSLWIRTTESISKDEEIMLQNWIFKKGDYFYDIKEKNTKRIINLLDLNNHKISKERLNRLIKKSECD